MEQHAGRIDAVELADAVEAVRDGLMDLEQSGRLLRFYEDGLHGYTYLEDPGQR